ncbi:AraC family transcriptional regulator [Burkholderia pyrrocinia]|uniref:AraC family transcriptional regulator n=1 Tax=Burkholderia pyrrocinia TaxID=60550 RepID=UPI001BCE9FC6|nr:AraC family transcriptional regulator [Burkholderia pyrrocinia]QVN23602.1 helix-turn-helix transcriptional regulator [Burkholderia pyrrocinia]
MASEAKKNEPAIDMQSTFARLSMDDLPASPRKDCSMTHAFKAVDARVPSDDRYRRRAVFSCPRAEFVCSQHAAVGAATTRSRLRMGPLTDARLAVARHYIENNLHRHDLTPVEIARALNCSRAQLYRLFGEHSMSVGETIKEARLARSLRYLQAGNP